MLVPAKYVVGLRVFSNTKLLNISQYLPWKAGKSIICSVVYASDELCSLHGDLEEYDVSGRK